MGRLSVEGRAELKYACVHVWGRCTVASEAELLVENCSNVDDWGAGGGVRVSGNLRVDGALEVHQSHSKRFGGGVYAFGASAQLLALAPRLRRSSSLGEDESHRMLRRSRWRTWGWEVLRG